MAHTHRLPTLALLAPLLALALGCQQPSGTSVNFKNNREGGGTPVATFGKDAITAEELQRHFSELSPYARARFQTVDARKDYVEGLARFELLAAEAVERGLHNDPDVVATAKKVMVQKLIQKELDEKPTPVSDEQVRAYYEAHKGDYVKPEMIRLSHIFLAAPKDDAKARAEKKAKAQAVLAEAKQAAPMDFAAFGKLARAHTEDEKTKALDGDLRYLSLEDLDAQLGAPVAEIAGQMRQVGQVSEIVETDRGFHVLKLQGRQAALDLQLERAKPQIQQRLLYERRQQNFANLLDGLKQKSGYKLDEAALGGVKVDPNAPAQNSRGTPPGFIPAPGAARGPTAPPAATR